MWFAGNHRKSRGQALAEFALVIPVFLLLLYGIIEFGRYVYTVQILNNAAREGARYAIVHGSGSLNSSGPAESGTTSVDPSGENVREVVRRFAVGVAGGGISFPVTTACVHGEAEGPCWYPNNARGSTVTVQVRTTFQTLLPIPLPSITVDGASTLVINN